MKPTCMHPTGSIILDPALSPLLIVVNPEATLKSRVPKMQGKTLVLKRTKETGLDLV